MCSFLKELVVSILSEESLGWGKAALGFEEDRIGALVSMATDTSHWVIIGKILLALWRHHFYRIFFILASNQDIYIISRTSSNFSQIRPRTADLAAIERLKNYHRLIMGKILLAL